jgi:hypothetical protein
LASTAPRTFIIDSPLPTAPPRWKTRSTPSRVRGRGRGRPGHQVPLNGLRLGAQVLRDRPLGMGEGIAAVEHAHALAAPEQGVDEVR